MYISTNEQLQHFIQRAKNSSALAIDTEFLREKTYYPQLCLLQMATNTETVIVDPFSVDSLDMLSSLFNDPSILKVFHAGSQDIEIIYDEIGVVPQPIFDTQIAASLLGYTLHVGYGALVQSLCGVNLKKSDSFTDWSKRPLSQSQLSYAANDVAYLLQVYRILCEKLEASGRTSWLEADFNHLTNVENYKIDPFTRYKHLKRVGQLGRKQLSAARELAAWRELTAMDYNIPRKWLLSDEQIVEACRREATTIDELFMVRGISEHLSTADARSACAAISKGLNLPQSQWPSKDFPKTNEANVDAEVDALAAIVRIRAKENNIAYQALASQADLVEVARGHAATPVLQGWRRTIVGNDLLAYMEGKLELHIENGKLKVTNRE